MVNNFPRFMKMINLEKLNKSHVQEHAEFYIKSLRNQVTLNQW